MRTVCTAGAFVLAAMSMAACADDEKSKGGGTTDSGAGDGSLAGAGGQAGDGGMAGASGSAGTGGSAGTAGGGGEGATTDAGPDVSEDAGPDATPDAVPDAPLMCPPMPAPDGGEGGVLDAGDGGDASGTILQWRDWAANMCEACPATPIDCDHFSGSAGTIDLATGTLSLRIAGGIAEMVSGSVSFRLYSASDGGSFGRDVTVSFSVDHDVLTADLSSELPADVTSIEQARLDIVDACGTSSSVDLGYYHYPSESGAVINLHCEM